MSSSKAVLVTGATGTLGSHAAAAILSEGTPVVAPVRRHHAPERVVATIAAAGGSEMPTDGWRDRLTVVPFPADLGVLDDVVAAHGVTEVVHCAGCLSYTDVAALEQGNVALTAALTGAAARWGIDRFVHVSTAFSGGYPDQGGAIPEELHEGDRQDPTPYTASKRRSEHVVARSGIPYLILRPSTVIGESQTGRYCGPRYGLYQLWSGIERFLLDEWTPTVDFVAPSRPLPLLHQDAWRTGLLGARRQLPDGAICHLTTRVSPTGRDIARLFFAEHLRPDRVRFHDHVEQVPLASIPRPQRALLRLARTNLDIAGHDWRFATTTLDDMTAAGVPFADATLETVRHCQEAYFAGSRRLARYRTALPTRPARRTDEDRTALLR